MTITLTNREKEILQILTQDNSTSVNQFSERLGVSEVTVRSDLNALTAKGAVVRTHGGAIPAFHPNIIERQKKMTQEKERIAKRAAELIEDGDNIMISAGTTPSLIPRYLLGRSNIHIVTNSTFILPFARVNPSIRVTFTGGEFMASGEAMIGPIALRELDKFRVKIAFVGTDGFSIEGGVAAHSVEVSEIVRKMSEQAEQTVLLTDSTKFGQTGFAHMLDIDDIDVLVTDKNLKEDDRIKLEKKGIKVIAV